MLKQLAHTTLTGVSGILGTRPLSEGSVKIIKPPLIAYVYKFTYYPSETPSYGRHPADTKTIKTKSIS